MVSTLFEKPHEPSPIEMMTLRSYARIAGDHLGRLIGTASFEQKAREMNAVLYARSGLAPTPQRALRPIHEIVLCASR
jgi:hypothetical protein